MVKWIAICSLNSAIRVQISEKTGILKPQPPPFSKFRKKKKITEERFTSSAYLKKDLPAVRYFGWLFSLMNIASSLADDNVINNDQVIMPELETVTF